MKTALIIGASGGVGGAVAAVLVERGWRVVGLTRTARQGKDGIHWVIGDAMNADDVLRAAQGAAVIFHGANPPQYYNWRGLALPMLANSIAAAEAVKARLVFPGSVYNFAPDIGEWVDETTPQRPTTRKGAIRVEMEQALADFAARGGRCVILRAGDFFGSVRQSSWFNGAIVKPNRPVTSLIYPGDPNIAHSWAYLPDLAETFAQLIEQDHPLGAFEVFHFKGHRFESGEEMIAMLREIVGNPDLPARRLPWGLMWLAAPFKGFVREMMEMRYLWQRPLSLDNRKLVAFLGAEPHTPARQALTKALVNCGCLAAA